MLASFFLALALFGQEAPASAASMNCNIGPVTRQVGGSEWQVYSCPDERTLILVSAPSNPAMPFWFMMSPVEGRYELYGEGSGSQAASRPAYDELTQMTEESVQALLRETRAAAAAPHN